MDNKKNNKQKEYKKDKAKEQEVKDLSESYKLGIKYYEKVDNGNIHSEEKIPKRH